MHDDSVTFSHQVKRLNKLVESRYGLSLLDYSSHPKHLADVSEHYREKYNIIKQLLGENAIAFSSEAAQAYLISEAARILLREIAPKRINKRKGSK